MDPKFLLVFKTRENFERKLADGVVSPEKHLVFIQDQKRVWFRGQFYVTEQVFDSAYNDFQVTQNKGNITITLKGKEWEESSNSFKDISKTLTLNLATSEVAGLMSSEDKSRIDSIWNGNPSLPTPTLLGNWTVYNQSNVAVTPTPAFPLEYGYKARYTGTWKWNISSDQKAPTKTSGNWGTTLPAKDTNSNTFTSEYVTTDTTYSQTIYADKEGLMVSGTSVVPASGQDSKSVSTKVTFSNRIYYGASDKNIPTEEIVKKLTTKLGTKSQTISGITTTDSQYYYYTYPQSLGKLTTIIQDGATPVLGAFKCIDTLSITNSAGLSIPLYVYISNNPGAFTNNTLKFE